MFGSTRGRVAALSTAGAVVVAGAVTYGMTRPAETSSSPASNMTPVKGEVRTIALHGQEKAPWAKGRPAAGIPGTGTESFSMLGITWDAVRTDLKGAVAIRTRSAGTGAWSPWQKLETDGGDTPDSRSPESSGSRGGTTPLWVGPSDGVEVRVLGRAGRELPDGLRVDLVDPGSKGHGRPSHAGPKKTHSKGPHGPKGTETPTATPGDPQPTGSETPTASPSPTSSPSAPSETPTPTPTASEPTASASPAPESPTPSRTPTPAPTASEPTASATPTASQSPSPTTSPSAPATPSPSPTETTADPAPRPAITSRAHWGADESLVKDAPDYDQSVKAVFVHHTDTGNAYTCDQSPQVIRSIFTYHVTSLGWNDIGYNFLVDKCGTLFEGRAGGVERPVHGAHTYGFNTDTTGVAVLGTHISAAPAQAVLDTVAKVSAWKLGIVGQNPAGKVTLTSRAPDGAGKYPYGSQVTLNAISGHRDGFATECPGEALYAKLPTIRTAASGL
ncbi:N-acetylmuramoyl-L-alanine amidase [Spirillospora sp. NPDC048819]|uniref:peptidoglycan recognition protein family protein n=1 Tax=Spirillospora sp. NPDC048819 TaxID=3155268 RepID=UPI0033DD8EC7